jgi:hypothetical protein
MDHQRFDALTMALAGGTSRRRVLKGVLASVAGGAVLSGREALAGEPVCIGPGGTCSAVSSAGAVPCCEGLLCCENAPDFCAECCKDDDCGSGEICCGGACAAIECCIEDPDPNERCPEGTSCFEGVCEFFCSTNEDCQEGTCCCQDGSCFAECCEKPEEPEEPPITDLPNTGAGDGRDRSSWLGAAALGGAAAFLAGHRLRRNAQGAEIVDE